MKKVKSSTGLAKISASCFFVEIYFIMISTDGLYVALALLRKWWYFIEMCLVRGVNFRYYDIEIEDRLSSWTVKQKLVVGVKRGTMQLISFANLLTGSASHSACYIAMYYASAAESSISVCNLMLHLQAS